MRILLRVGIVLPLALAAAFLALIVLLVLEWRRAISRRKLGRIAGNSIAAVPPRGAKDTTASFIRVEGSCASKTPA
jgi:hypothetical protein